MKLRYEVSLLFKKKKNPNTKLSLILISYELLELISNLSCLQLIVKTIHVIWLVCVCVCVYIFFYFSFGGGAGGWHGREYLEELLVSSGTRARYSDMQQDPNSRTWQQGKQHRQQYD